MQKSSVDITESELKELEELAALFFSPREIALMLEIDEEEFILASQLPNAAIYKAFYRGRLQSEVDLRKGIIKLAKSGSSPAQTMAMDLLNKSKLKLLDR